MSLIALVHTKYNLKMIRFNHKHQLSPKDYLYRVFFAIACIFILVLCLPRDGASKYSYRLHEPWDDLPVIAKDSFPIFKSDADIQREKDSLHRYYEPYFLWDTDKQQAMVDLFEKEFPKVTEGNVPSYYLHHLLKKFAHVYQQGIMESQDYDRLVQEETRLIRVFKQNESESRHTDQIFTPKTAYEYLMAEEDSTRFTHAKLMKCDLSKYISPNLLYDVRKSQQQKAEVDGMLVPYMGQVQAGQKLVDKGQIVDEYTFQVLASLERHQQGRSMTSTERLVILGGQTLYVTIMIMLLMMYFEQFRRDYIERMRTVLLVICQIIIFPLITYSLIAHSLMHVYVIPYCMIPLLIRIFMDSRTAFITHFITIMICAASLAKPFEFIAIQTVAGLVTIYSLSQLSRRSELFRAVVIVVIATLLTNFCIDLMKTNILHAEGIDRWTYIYLVIAGILSLLSYLLLIPIERVFGFTSVVTLVELSDINNPLLRRLSEEAPGTFQHSMQVANLAAEVANRIGAESQLVRTGALYHDIGKLENSVFFTENQSGTNPHNALPCIQSAQIIIQHVKYGLALAEKYKLPTVIREFISTHHGLSMAKYFYISYKNAFPNSQVDESLFTYPGPNPHTLEQAILMMADSVEAASRSLKEYTEENINTMVDKIVNGQVEAGFFNLCPITFLDINEAKEVFKAKLRTIYHTRIQYPELK